MVRLFVGAFLQFVLGAAAIRYCSVEPTAIGVAVTNFVMQTVWWTNIQGVKRTDRWRDYLSWTAGATLGSVSGYLLTGGRL